MEIKKSSSIGVGVGNTNNLIMAVNQLKAGAILNYVILALNAIIGLTYIPYMLRMLGQSEYGIYSLAASVIAYLSMLDFGFGNAVIRYTAKYRSLNDTEKQYSMFGMFTILYTIIGVISFIAGLILYFNVYEFFGDKLTPEEIEKTKDVILLMLLNLSISFPLSIYGAIITAYEDFIFIRVVNIIQTLLSTALIIVLLSFGYKALALVVVKTIFNLLVLLINVFYCKYKIKIKVRFDNIDKKLLKEILIYSSWIFLIMIMDKIYWSTGQFVLGAVAGTTAISIYAVAIQLQQIYMMFSGAISSVFLPRVTSIVAQGDDYKIISDLFIRTGRLQYIVMSLILTGFFLFGKPFILYWAGTSYEDSYYVTLMFFVALTIPMIQTLGLSILQARNQMRFRALMFVVIAIVAFAAQIILAKKYGVIGCAMAVSVALLLGQGLIINIYYQKRQYIEIGKFWKEIGKMSAIPLLMTVVWYAILRYITIDSLYELVALIVVYVIVYIPLFWKYSLNLDERELISKSLKKIRSILK